MSAHANPDIITDNLELCLDAWDKKSYSGSGSVWYDRAGNSYNGNLVTDATFNSTQKAIESDGTGGHVYGDIDPTIFGSDFTISCWFNRHSAGSWDALFSNNRSSSSWSNSDKEGAILGFRGSGGTTDHPNAISVGINAVGTSNYGVYINLGSDHYNKWINLTLTRVGTAINLYAYKEGELLTDSGTYSSYSISTSNDQYLVGRHWYNSGSTSTQILNGWINSVNVYSKALTAAEVLQNYNATKSRFSL